MTISKIECIFSGFRWFCETLFSSILFKSSFSVQMIRILWDIPPYLAASSPCDINFLAVLISFHIYSRFFCFEQVKRRFNKTQIWLTPNFMLEQCRNSTQSIDIFSQCCFQEGFVSLPSKHYVNLCLGARWQSTSIFVLLLQF